MRAFYLILNTANIPTMQMYIHSEHLHQEARERIQSLQTVVVLLPQSWRVCSHMLSELQD